MLLTQPQGHLADALDTYAEAVAHWGREAPDRIAIEHEGGSTTYGALSAAMQTLADRLAALGLRHRDRIFIVGENTLGTVLLVLAANRVGAAASVVNARMATSEIRVLRDFAEPRLTAFATRASAKAGEHAAALGAGDQIGDGPFEGIRICPADPDSPPEPASADRRAETALIMFTSGTTGLPKGVMLSNATMLEQAKAQCVARLLTPADTLYAVSPLSHNIGLVGNVLASFAAGCRTILPVRHDPAYLARKLAAGEITVIVGVPQLYAGLIEHAAANGIGFDAARLRVGGSGGAPLDPALKARVKAVLGVTLSNGYGATEFVPVSRTPLDMLDRDLASNVVGVLSEGVDLRIVGEDGQDMPEGESGEIWVRGPFMMQGYFRNPEATAEVMRPGGWLATGDMGEYRDGLLSIVGRKKEIIIRSGFNVYPTDVEAALSAHPDVSMAAVLGRAVPGNEEIVAFVTPLPGHSIDPAALKDFTRRDLTPYKVPTEIVVLDEMPIGPTGKILKTALKSRL